MAKIKIISAKDLQTPHINPSALHQRIPPLKNFIVLDASKPTNGSASLHYIDEAAINKDPENPGVSFTVQPSYDLWQGVALVFKPINPFKKYIVEFTLEIPESNTNPYNNEPSYEFMVNATNSPNGPAYEVLFDKYEPIKIELQATDYNAELSAGVYLMNAPETLTNWRFKKAVLRWT